LLLGLGIPLAILLLADFFNNKIVSEEELKKLTSLSIAGHIPHNDKEFQTVVLKDTNSMVSEAFRSLRTRMQFFLKDAKSPLVLVTSSMPGEGKTFTALNLASAYSLTGKKTLLMGFDLRRPKLYTDFDLNNEKGVSTYLIGKDSLNDIIQKTEFPNLHLITAGPVPPNPAELAASEKMKELVAKLKEIYDYIIVDSAPIGTVSDSYAVAGLADATLLIVRHKKTLKNLLENTLSEAKANEVKGLSILVNDMDTRSLSYRYAYSYGYGYKYEKDK
jgi:capsular exopolysaccharide synthesis family protein